jgi:hypothetical protein
VLTGIGHIEQGEAGLELGQEKPCANLLDATLQLHRHLVLVRAVRHEVGS